MLLIYILFLSYWVKKWTCGSNICDSSLMNENLYILLFKTEHFSMFMNFFNKFSF